MIGRKERELLLQQLARQQLLRGQIDRREFMSRALMTGLGLAGAGVAAKFGVGSALAQRPLTPCREWEKVPASRREYCDQHTDSYAGCEGQGFILLSRETSQTCSVNSE